MTNIEIVMALIIVILLIKDALQDRIKNKQMNMEDLKEVILALRPIVAHTPTTADDQLLDIGESIYEGATGDILPDELPA